jgi:Ca-activated chloride channel family protein
MKGGSFGGGMGRMGGGTYSGGGMYGFNGGMYGGGGMYGAGMGMMGGGTYGGGGMYGRGTYAGAGTYGFGGSTYGGGMGMMGGGLNGGGMGMMGGGMMGGHGMGGMAPPGLLNGPGAAPTPVLTFARNMQNAPGQAAQSRFGYAKQVLENLPQTLTPKQKNDVYYRQLLQARDRWDANNQANAALKKGDKGRVQTGKLGVDLSCESNNLRHQTQLTQSAVCRLGARNALEVGGVWIDEAFDPKMKTITVKAGSKVYFRILELHPQVRDVYKLGNHLVWVTPSNTALVIDASNGVAHLSDTAIAELFTAPRPKKK